MKKRLDILLVEKGLVQSREKAKALIAAGLIYADGSPAAKPGENFPEETVLELRGEAPAYVSRGGLKLEKAVKEFSLDLSGLICMDVGASTGGFTDCMLQNGAVKVFAVDVGSGQLDGKLLRDSRVINLERTNARYLNSENVPDKIDFFSVDVSFISLSLILPAIRPLLSDDGQGVCLIKPQFEAGKENIGKRGVVKDRAVHRAVIEKITGLAVETGFSVAGLTFSPVKGPEGNIEYLIYLKNAEKGEILPGTPGAEEVVERSHMELDGI